MPAVMIRKYAYFVVGSLMCCAVLTMSYIVLPLQEWKYQLPEACQFLISDYHITFQQHFHHDLYHNQCVTMWDQLIICVQYTRRTFQSYLRVFVVIGVIYHFNPMILGILYTILPDWASELPGKIIECLSGDESEPPELEIDPSATTFATICSRNVSSNSLTSSKGSNGVSEKRWRIRAMTALNSDDAGGGGNTTTSPIHSPVRHVFDPVFGVIPEDVRDRWSSSSLDNNKKKSSSLSTSINGSNTGKSHTGEETTDVSQSAVGTADDKDKKNVGIRVSRVLPPVRFSLSPTTKTQEKTQEPETKQNAKD